MGTPVGGFCTLLLLRLRLLNVRLSPPLPPPLFGEGGFCFCYASILFCSLSNSLSIHSAVVCTCAGRACHFETRSLIRLVQFVLARLCSNSFSLLHQSPMHFNSLETCLDHPFPVWALGFCQSIPTTRCLAVQLILNLAVSI